MSIALKSGSLTLLEPLGAVQPCNGMALKLFWLEWQGFLFVQSDASVYFLEIFNELLDLSA